MTACHCSGFMRMMSVSRVMPALLTSTSTVPHLSTASLINLCWDVRRDLQPLRFAVERSSRGCRLLRMA